MSQVFNVLSVAVPVVVAGLSVIGLMRAREHADRYESHAHVLQQLKKVIDSPEAS